MSETKHPHPGPIDPLLCSKCGVPEMRPGGGVVRNCDCPPTMSKPCIHNHVTDEAGQLPCVNCLRARITTRDLQLAITESRAQRAEDLLSRNEGRIEKIVDAHLAARVAALEGALEKIGERACEINGWETACDYKCCDIAKAALAAPGDDTC